MAIIEKINGHSSELNADRLTSAKWKAAGGTRTGDNFIETISPLYLKLALHIERTIGLFCCENVFDLVFFLFRIRINRPRRGLDIKKWDCHGKTELFLHQVARSICVHRTPDARSQFQANNRGCSGT